MLTLTAAAAAVVHTFQKTTIVSHESEIPVTDVTIERPGGDGTMNSLEERASGLRYSDEDWANVIDDGGLPDTLLDSIRMEVISTDPALRIRRITQFGGAEKMQYTAADPVDLLPMLSGKVQFDLSWMRENYAAAEGSDQLYLVHDAAGAFSNEYFSALYGTQDGNGYVQFTFSYDMDKLPDQKYIAEDSYDKAYYYTTADGNEFLIKAYNETVWATCENAHAYVHLYCARLTTETGTADHFAVPVDCLLSLSACFAGLYAPERLHVGKIRLPARESLARRPGLCALRQVGLPDSRGRDAGKARDQPRSDAREQRCAAARRVPGVGDTDRKIERIGEDLPQSAFDAPPPVNVSARTGASFVMGSSACTSEKASPSSTARMISARRVFMFTP